MDDINLFDVIQPESRVRSKILVGDNTELNRAMNSISWQGEAILKINRGEYRFYGGNNRISIDIIVIEITIDHLVVG